MYIAVRILLVILLVVDMCFVGDFDFTHPTNPYDYEKEPERYDQAEKYKNFISAIRFIAFFASMGTIFVILNSLFGKD